MPQPISLDGILDICQRWLEQRLVVLTDQVRIATEPSDFFSRNRKPSRGLYLVGNSLHALPDDAPQGEPVSYGRLIGLIEAWKAGDRTIAVADDHYQVVDRNFFVLTFQGEVHWIFSTHADGRVAEMGIHDLSGTCRSDCYA